MTNTQCMTQEALQTQRTAQCALSVITTNGTFKLTQCHWYLCHSTGHTWFIQSS